MTSADRYKVFEEEPIVAKEIDLSWIKYVALAIAAIIVIAALIKAGEKVVLITKNI